MGGSLTLNLGRLKPWMIDKQHTQRQGFAICTMAPGTREEKKGRGGGGGSYLELPEVLVLVLLVLVLVMAVTVTATTHHHHGCTVGG